MSDWIKDAVARIKKQDAERKQREEGELLKANLLREQAPLLWQQLCSQLETDAQQLNAAFRDEPRRHLQLEEFDPNTLSLCKPASPVSKLHLHYSQKTYTITYEFEAEWGNPPCRERDNASMQIVTAHDRVYIGDSHKLPEEVSQQLLLMFLNAEGF
jgi:hypothetical protein